MALTNITTMYPLIEQTFIYNKLFIYDWVISLIIIALSVILITRDIHKWQMIALPITVMWNIAELNITPIWYAIISITFVLETVSIQTIGHLLRATAMNVTITKTKEKLSEIIIPEKQYRETKQYADMREKQEKSLQHKEWKRRRKAAIKARTQELLAEQHATEIPTSTMITSALEALPQKEKWKKVKRKYETGEQKGTSAIGWKNLTEPKKIKTKKKKTKIDILKTIRKKLRRKKKTEDE